MQLGEVFKFYLPTRSVEVYNQVEGAAFLPFNRIPDVESRDIRKDIRSRFGGLERHREVFLFIGKFCIKLRVLFQRKRSQFIPHGLCPKQPVEENIEAGKLFNLNYSMYVINFQVVKWMKHERYRTVKVT